MLSRTADTLYWIARSTQRAETAARLPEVAHASRFCSPQTGIATIGTVRCAHRAMPTASLQDMANPSLIVSSIMSARENGRSVRTALTTQVWDAQNTPFMELRQIEARPATDRELSQMTDWTMRHATMVRGAVDATLPRNDGYNLLNIGYCLGRGDSTARLTYV